MLQPLFVGSSLLCHTSSTKFPPQAVVCHRIDSAANTALARPSAVLGGMRKALARCAAHMLAKVHPDVGDAGLLRRNRQCSWMSIAAVGLNTGCYRHCGQDRSWDGHASVAKFRSVILEGLGPGLYIRLGIVATGRIPRRACPLVFASHLAFAADVRLALAVGPAAVVACSG